MNLTEGRKGVSVKIFPAVVGDTILVDIAGQLILIDGGYVNTYSRFLKSVLLSNKSRGLSLLIVTHIDADHISGINKLLSENSENAVIPIEHIWHNSYRHIQGIPIDLSKYESLDGKTLDDLPELSYLKEDKAEIRNVSAEQGSSLAAMILKGRYKWNEAFSGKAISVDNKNKITLSKDLKLILLSPDDRKLKELHKEWRKELYRKGYKLESKGSDFYDDAFEFLIALQKPKKTIRKKDISASLNLSQLADSNFDDDTSETNGSSIAFVIEHKGFKGLFLGDAHPGIVAKNVTENYKHEVFPIKFDVIKVSHHGSIANSSKELFNVIDSEKYIISTNSLSYQHPDMETLARIVTRPTNFTRTLYFNYPIAAAHLMNQTELKEKYGYEVVIGDGESIIEPINL